MGSGYGVLMDVFASAAGKLTHTGACGSDQLSFLASAGTTYYVMVSATAFGGDLVFSVVDLGPPFQLTLSVAGGSVDQSTTGPAAPPSGAP